jgi:23S rRNA (pseudouridine1915-N3)-methyltransferase
VRLLVVAVGRLKDGPERTLVARYRERLAPLGRSTGLGTLDIVEVEEGRGRRAEERRREEAAGISAALPAGSRVIALDERGKPGTTAGLADEIRAARDGGTACISFVIGGPDGLDEAFRKSAAATLSFGGMTLPHQLVRVLLAEQIYRVATLLTGHPYHRA